MEPAKRAAALNREGCRPLCGLYSISLGFDPGACAPGFILPPASQVPRTTCFAASGHNIL